MPRKIHDLINDLEQAGFLCRGSNDRHQRFIHPARPRPLTLFGSVDEDALRYQEKATQLAIEDTKR